MSIIKETVLQPRTGSQCPQDKIVSSASGPTSICQGGTEDDKRISWKPATAQYLTLGFQTQVDGDKSCDPGTAENYWGWGATDQSGNGHNLCIAPVEELCSMNYWDGYDYDPTRWEQNALKDTVDSASFKMTCNQQVGSSNHGNETGTFSQSCPLQCNYDASKFTTIEQVLAYEEKFNKYLRDVDQCENHANYNDYRQCQAQTSGRLLNTKPSQIFKDNYNAIMENFCAQQTTTCRTDPQSVAGGNPKNMPKCSFLMSAGPEGKKCRTWLNMNGPYKFSKMQAVGDKYCTKYPDSLDCSCYSRDDPNNPNYETFKAISQQLSPLGLDVPCWYLPCADPTNYIIGNSPSGTFTQLPDSPGTGEPDSSYGFHCIDNLCATIVNNGGSAYSDMNQNSLYIQCGDGVGPSWYIRFQMFIETQPHIFYLFVGAFILFLIIVGLIIFRIYQKNKTTYIAKPTYR